VGEGSECLSKEAGRDRRLLERMEADEKEKGKYMDKFRWGGAIKKEPASP